MSFMDKFKGFIAPLDPADDELMLDEQEASALSEYEAPANRGIGDTLTNAKMVLFEPREFEETQEIGQKVKERKAVVVNLHRLPSEYAQRAIDFLTGVVFALDGTIQKVGTNVILCSPKNIPVKGEIGAERV